MGGGEVGDEEEERGCLHYVIRSEKKISQGVAGTGIPGTGVARGF